jgi:hypothetical protein
VIKGRGEKIEDFERDYKKAGKPASGWEGDDLRKNWDNFSQL